MLAELFAPVRLIALLIGATIILAVNTEKNAVIGKVIVIPEPVILLFIIA